MTKLSTAKTIQGILDGYGIENDSLNTFIKEVDEMPDEKTLETFNSLVEDYQKAGSSDNVIRSAEALLDFYEQHKSELSYKASEMDRLDAKHNVFLQANNLYQSLDTAIEDNDLEQAFNVALDLQNLLKANGVNNDSLDAFINQVTNFPDPRITETFNDLVETFKNSSGYDSIVSNGSQLVDYYNAHSESLNQDGLKDKIQALSETIDDMKEIKALMDTLDEEG